MTFARNSIPGRVFGVIHSPSFSFASITPTSLIDAGYPPPQTQIPLYDKGYLVAYLDMGWQEIRIAAEYDGDQHRTDRAQYVKDIRRSEFVDSLGWLNIRVVAEKRVDVVIEQVARAWARREQEGMVVNLPR